MDFKRCSGILAHPTSFPTPYGIGDLGPAAYDFIDFAHRSGARLWQVLPLGPTGFGDSPYQSFSTFAGNPLLISPDILLKDRLLSEEDVADPPECDPRNVDYGSVLAYKEGLYRKAFENFRKVVDVRLRTKRGFEAFCAENAFWLNDYALFAATKAYFIKERRSGAKTREYYAYAEKWKDQMRPNAINDVYYGAAWYTWPERIKTRENLYALELLLRDEIMYHKFLQFMFFKQWAGLKAYANSRGISIIGDIPIFVAMDSADTWAGPGLFLLDPDGSPTSVAGVPPDYFCETGQLWGNPLYNWEAHRREGYGWWIRRVESVLKLVDILRIDHFRGFDAFWAVPYGEKTAVNGKWRKGPGKELFEHMRDALGDLPLIAEDLGVITESVEQLRDGLGLPGMKVLQFAFGGGPAHTYLPHNYDCANVVVYTGTHDNDTTIGWYESADEGTRDCFRRYLNVKGSDAAWDLIRAATSSTAAYAVAPLQDVLNLGAESRMNIPGSICGNWRFRYTSDMLTESLSDGLLYLNTMFNRIPPAEEPPEYESLDIDDYKGEKI